VGIEKLELPSLAIPNLFLAEKISQFHVQPMTDRNGAPTPPSSPGPPGLVHPSFVARSTTIHQSLKENHPVRRGSDPGTFNRTMMEGGGVSYKSAVQCGALVNGSDGYAKSNLNATRGSPLPLQMENADVAITGANDHGPPSRRINPRIVELIESLLFAMDMKLTIYPSGCASVNCSPCGNVS
jgi:hypothetical protein